MSTPTIGFGPYKGPDRIAGGPGGTGPGGEVVVPPGTTTKPTPTQTSLIIANLTLTTGFEQQPNGIQAWVRATWSMPVQGEHETDVNGIGHYEVAFTTFSAPGWSPDAISEARTVTFRGLPTERDIAIRVRARTNGGVRGPYTEERIRTSKDNEPPPVPSKPKVFALLKSAVLMWDGLFAGGEPMPDDFTRVDGQLSLDPNFAGEDTFTFPMGDQERASGSASFARSGKYTVYGRIRARDDSGNLSVYSEVASDTTMQLLPDDVGEGAITAGKLADAAVAANNILQHAVTTFGLAPGSVKVETLADLAVATEKIGTRAVQSLQIAFDAIQPENLVDGAVITAKLAPLSVLGDKLAANAVTLGKIGPNAVDNLALISGSVSTNKVAAEAITKDLIGKLAVQARHAGFTVAGANQLENSSFDNPDAPLEYWRADGNAHLAVVAGSLVHGKVALQTTFDESAPPAPALTAT